MNLIERIVDGFILTMGITPPTPRTRRLATIFIASAIVLTVLGVVSFFVLVLTRIDGR